MPDICMCNDYSCPDFDECYRAQAKPSIRQTYFTESPREKELCFYCWPIEQVDKNCSKSRKKSENN